MPVLFSAWKKIRSLFWAEQKCKKMFSPSCYPSVDDGRHGGRVLSWNMVVSSYQNVTSRSPGWLPSLQRTKSLFVLLSVAACLNSPSAQPVPQTIWKPVPDRETGLAKGWKKQVMRARGGGGGGVFTSLWRGSWEGGWLMISLLKKGRNDQAEKWRGLQAVVFTPFCNWYPTISSKRPLCLHYSR